MQNSIKLRVKLNLRYMIEIMNNIYGDKCPTNEHLKLFTQYDHILALK